MPKILLQQAEHCQEQISDHKWHLWGLHFDDFTEHFKVVLTAVQGKESQFEVRLLTGQNISFLKWQTQSNNADNALSFTYQNEFENLNMIYLVYAFCAQDIQQYLK